MDAAAAGHVMGEFPSVEWFQRLVDRMRDDADTYKRLGVVDLTLIAKIDWPGGRSERYGLVFAGYGCTSVGRLPDGDPPPGRYAVILEGEVGAWKEMVENIRAHGGADLTHTLNYLTLPDWPLRLVSASAEDQLDVDRFYRYNESLQHFFNGAAVAVT
jgi:hypothetical protein